MVQWNEIQVWLALEMVFVPFLRGPRLYITRPSLGLSVGHALGLPREAPAGAPASQGSKGYQPYIVGGRHCACPGTEEADPLSSLNK